MACLVYTDKSLAEQKVNANGLASLGLARGEPVHSVTHVTTAVRVGLGFTDNNLVIFMNIGVFSFNTMLQYMIISTCQTIKINKNTPLESKLNATINP